MSYTAQRTSNLYHTPRWREARARHLSQCPWCLACAGKGQHTPATVVDHDPPHRGNTLAFWDQSRFVSLCFSCHQSKTAKEIRARMNPKRPEERHPGLIEV